MYPLLSGSGAIAGALVDIVDEKGVRWARVVAGPQGSWSVSDLSGGGCTTVADAYLPPGTHRLAARQTVGGRTSALSAAVVVTVAEPPVFLAPTPGSTVSSSEFEITIHGTPSASVQRIKLPDPSPCRPKPMILNAAGSFSQEFSVDDPGEVTLGIRYIDPATGRHGPARFVTFVAG